jgi:hypothetical protein
MRISITIAGIILCCFLGSMNAQDAITSRMIHPTSVTLIKNPSESVHGALYQVKDSSIMISNSTKSIDYTFDNPNFNVSELYIKDIERIKSRNDSRFLYGILIGAASGFFIGYGMGLASDPNFLFSRQNLALLGGLGMTPVGAVVGGIIGSAGIIIPINGSMDNYNRNKSMLIKLSLMK